MTQKPLKLAPGANLQNSTLRTHRAHRAISCVLTFAGASWRIFFVMRVFGCRAAAHVPDELRLKTSCMISLVLGVKDIGNITRYLNITCNYLQEEGRFLLSQSDYIIRLLEEYDMLQPFEVSIPIVAADKDKWQDTSLPVLDAHNKRHYQALVSSLLYLMRATRPDIAYTMIRLSQYASHPRSAHWEVLLRVLRYLKRTRHANLVLGGSSKNLDANHTNITYALIGFFDGAHADIMNRRYMCGYLFLWNGSPISWCSKVQRTVALSTTEAEYMAMMDIREKKICVQTARAVWRFRR